MKRNSSALFGIARFAFQSEQPDIAFANVTVYFAVVLV